MININTATAADLMQIRHIGYGRALAIVRQRQERRFRDLFELSVISGLGKKRVQDIINQGLARI